MLFHCPHPGPCPPARVKKELSDEEPMQTDMGENSYVPGPDENPLYTAEPLTLDDLKLLSDLFYLPYEHGATARTMLQELDWLKNHSTAAFAESDKVMWSVLQGAVTEAPLLRDQHPQLLLFRQGSGAQERSSSMKCARRWCRCSAACRMSPTAASCTTSTTTSPTSKAGSVWPEPT